MKLIGFINLLFCMQLSYHAIAQDPEIVDWSDATQLPSQSGKPHPGLAGAVTGIHNNILLIAGGANFPDGLPWEGGKKNTIQPYTCMTCHLVNQHIFLQLITCPHPLPIQPVAIPPTVL